MQANQNPGNGTPNIQKLVPVKKNGFILELQVPAPNGSTASSNQSIQPGIINPATSTSINQAQQGAPQRQQVANIPNQQQNIVQQNRISNPNPNQSQNPVPQQNPQNVQQIPPQNTNQLQTEESQNPLSLRKLFGG